MDCLVIVRSVGERTTKACAGVYPGAVVLSGVTPFWRTLQQCLEMGLDARVGVLACIDADVLPRAGVVPLVAQMMRKNPALSVVAPKLDDKLTGIRRTVGIHIYNGAYLEQALAELPKMASLARPESTLRRRLMSGRKKPRMPGPHGRHGYEQYYRDTYRTVLLWQHKQANNADWLLPYWEQQTDPDFRVALQAWEDGKRLGVKTCDASRDIDYDAVLDALGLQEKQPL